MLEKSEVKSLVDEKSWAMIENDDETYLVFENETASYSTEKNKIMVREFYFRPCMKYPKGYFYITVRGHILDEGNYLLVYFLSYLQGIQKSLRVLGIGHPSNKCVHIK